MTFNSWAGSYILHLSVSFSSRVNKRYLCVTLLKTKRHRVDPTLCLSASTIRSRRPGSSVSFFEALKASPISETSTWDWNRMEKIPHQNLVWLTPAPLSLDLQRASTHKLLALEQVAVVGVCCRVSRHETKDFWSQRQDGGVGDGGERAGVEQELRGQRRQERGG